MILTRKFEFDAAHTLSSELGSKENKMHGHRYILEVSVTGPVRNGVVMDVAIIKDIVGREVLDKLDHSYINDFIEHPTAENIFVWIWGRLKNKLDGLFEIKLYETPNNYVTYTGE